MKRRDIVRLIAPEEVFDLIGNRFDDWAWPEPGAIGSVTYVDHDPGDDPPAVMVRFLPPWTVAQQPQMLCTANLELMLPDLKSLDWWLAS